MLRSVLIVEDSPSMAKVLEAHLNELGITKVVWAENGRQALETIQNHPTNFHGIITDLNMPEMDGMEFLSHLGSSGYRGGVIVVSALEDRVITSAVDLARRQHVHLVGFLTKPVLMDRLTLMIHRIKHLRRFVSLSESLVKRAQLYDALNHNQVIPYYQPKVNGKTHRIEGYEILARVCLEGQVQVIGPDRFIPVAYKHDMLNELTFALLNSAFADYTQLQEACGHDIKLSFNLMPGQLQNVKMPDLLDELCQRFEIQSKQIILEVTERQPMEQSVQLATMDRLRIHGYGVSLDDFGTGFTNMGQLRSHPFSEIKLDESLVANIAVDRFSQVLLQSMSAIAKELNIDLVAEGVEHIDDYNFVVENSEAIIQGFIVSRPKPINEALRWTHAWAAQNPQNEFNTATQANRDS